MTPESVQPAAPFFKDPTPLILHDDQVLEGRLELTPALITPIPYFFVRNNGSSVAIDAATWRLTIDGEGVTHPLALSYADLQALPSRTLTAYLECAGNHRRLFEIVQGRPTEGTPWLTGGVGNATWTGVPLVAVLEMAGVRADAVNLLCIGADRDAPEGGFRRVLPIAKALDPDTLLVYAMNDAPLPKDHGYPLRLLTPGWVGSSWIKWLEEIVVATRPLWARNNTTHYVLIGDEFPPEGEAAGQVVTTQVINSALALPWPAELEARPQQVAGFAHTPSGLITQVAWSDDQGATWHPADLVGPRQAYAWTRFEFTWVPQPGSYTLLTRATDDQGHTQPLQQRFNQEGYLFHQPAPHPITVVAAR
jgi:DMSO/TMAO reductase YedYZ molybdopterin-dependent catalytic subunit